MKTSNTVGRDQTNAKALNSGFIGFDNPDRVRLPHFIQRMIPKVDRM